MEDSFSLITNDSRLLHLIDTNKESIENINKHIIEIESASDENIQNIANDIFIINQKLNQFLESHQSSSKYGGIASESIQLEDAGPSLINLSTS